MHIENCIPSKLRLVLCPELLARRAMTDNLTKRMAELAQLREEAKAERAGQGREQILQSIQKDMASIEAQLKAAGHQHALHIQMLSIDLDVHPISCWHQLSRT